MSIFAKLLFFSLISFAGVSSMAQAQMMAPPNPQFMPTSGWSVEKTTFAQTQGLAGVRLPCMMAATYDNGYILRFSGNSGQMLAMAIDFRQDVFKQGRKYSANLGFNQGAGFNVTATAFSESTLIFNLRPISGFYQQMMGATALALDVEGNIFTFGLGNTQEALARLESCFGGPIAPSMGPVDASLPAPDAPAMKDWNEKVSPQSASAPSALPTPPMASWSAKEGDDIRTTLQRWAAQAGVALRWQADRSGRVVSDINVSGSFAEAVQLLMAQNVTAIGIDANMGGMPMAPVSPATPIMQPPQPISPISAPPASTQAARWSAPAGANLQLVLQKWSKDEGVDFVWQSHHHFILKQPVNTGNSYEAALQAVLTQFTSDNIRPAAQLNNDPQTGERILIVKSSRVL